MLRTSIGLAGAAVAFGLAAHSVLGENDAPASEVRKGQKLGPLMVVSGMFCTSESAALQFTKDYVAAVRKDPALSFKAAEGIAVIDSMRHTQGFCFYSEAVQKRVFLLQPVKHRWVVQYKDPLLAFRIFAFRLRHVCVEESCHTFGSPTYYFSFVLKKQRTHTKPAQET